MKSDLAKIYFCFPKIRPKNRQELLNSIIKLMQKDMTIRKVGFIKEKVFRNYLSGYFKNFKPELYEYLQPRKQRSTKRVIYQTIKICNKILPLPIKNFIFVFPWFPSKEDKIFEGVMGFTPYKGVIHLFINPKNFSYESLAETVAHEIAHSISFYYNFDRFEKWTLLEWMIEEGFAENFKEDVFKKTKISFIGTALTKKQAFQILKSLKSILNSRSRRLFKIIFFGSKKYKRWTGYSIGYWLVKEFKRNRKITWEELIKTKPKEIFKSVISLFEN